MTSEPQTAGGARVAGPCGAPAAPSASSHGASHDATAVSTLKQAMRRASIDSAERAGVVSDLRAARLGRLEMLQEALRPLAAQIPPDVDLFDIGILPGIDPRLFIDVIGFVEMGRDMRVYRFFQDTRHGRKLIVESATIDTLVDAITDYVARRLLERERALAASDDAPLPAGGTDRRPDRVPMDAAHATARRSPVHWLAAAFWFLIHLLGSVTFFLLLAFAGWLAWNGMHRLT